MQLKKSFYKEKNDGDVSWKEKYGNCEVNRTINKTNKLTKIKKKNRERDTNINMLGGKSEMQRERFVVKDFQEKDCFRGSLPSNKNLL